MKVLFIGLGHMGSALIKNIVKNKDFIVYGYHYDQTKLISLTNKLNIKPFFNLEQIKTEGIETIVLGVRVPDVESVIQQLDQFDLGKMNLVSMASGITIKQIKSVFKNNHPEIIRIMPNINAEYGLSTTAITDNVENEKIITMFEQCGKVFKIKEELFSNFTIAAGCMPAYAIYLVNEWIKNANTNGMNNDDAQKIIIDTFINSLLNWKQSGKTADQLINEIAVPNGVTIEGIKELKTKIGSLEEIISGAYTRALKKDEGE